MLSAGDSPPRQHAPTHITGSISNLTSTHNALPTNLRVEKKGHKSPPECLETFLRNVRINQRESGDCVRLVPVIKQVSSHEYKLLWLSFTL